jgi:pimeloyl-ACP methyl ester carboxylesterase
MPRTAANGIEIEYDLFGSESDRPLLLIMGLGAQMILWDDEFCAQLAACGHRVIRFDNRDVGLSTKLDHAPAPSPMKLMQARLAGETLEVPYTLEDMADDAAGLLDALGIERSHVAGASMGGMIAQTLAIRHPSRVRSLTSIMSTTGNPNLPPGTPEAMAVLLEPPPTERAAAIERGVAVSRVVGSPGFPFDEARIRERSARLYDRAFYPVGVARQLAAVMAGESRVEALGSLRIPALVIHGDADPLVPVEGGRDTHAAIPGAELLLIEGMGHDMPPETWPRITRAIGELTGKAEIG